MLTLLPWHRIHWSHIVRARQSGRLAHGLLLKGPAGAGAYEFARFLGGSLLCNNPDDNYFPCGVCKSCYLYDAGNHTDLLVLQPEEQGKQIRVDQIRSLIEFANLKSQFEGYKVIIFNPADAMNRSAANTLLKTLEEPSPFSIFMLVTQQAERLPITIRSRCQQILFQPDFSPHSRAWLSDKINDQKLVDELLLLSNGAPLAALEMYKNGSLEKQYTLLADMGRLIESGEDPIKTAKQWNELGTEQVLRWALQVIVDMIKFITTNTANKLVSQTKLQKLTNRLDLYKLMSCYDLLMQNYRLCTGQVYYDTQGLLEEFIIHWQKQHQQSGG